MKTHELANLLLKEKDVDIFISTDESDNNLFHIEDIWYRNELSIKRSDEPTQSDMICFLSTGERRD